MATRVIPQVGKKRTTYGASVVFKGRDFWVGTFPTPKSAKAAALAAEVQLEELFKAGEELALDKEKLAEAPKLLTISAYVEQWPTLQPDGNRGEPRSESTWAYHLAQVKPFVEQFGDLDFDDVDREAARRWHRKRPRGSASLSALWNDAIRDAKLTGATSNPWTLLPKPKNTERAEQPPLSNEQLRALLDTALVVHGPEYGPVIACAIELSATSGIRQGELLALTWNDLDLDAGLIHVRETVSRDRNGAYSVRKAPKSGKTRKAVLHPAVRDRLRALPRSADAGDLVFWNKHGRALTPTALWNIWHAVRVHAPGVPRETRWHDLRHRAGYWAYGMPVRLGGLGLDSRAAAAMLGHADDTLIKKLYGHEDVDEQLRKVQDAIDQQARGDAEPLDTLAA